MDITQDNFFIGLSQVLNWTSAWKYNERTKNRLIMFHSINVILFIMLFKLRKHIIFISKTTKLF